MVSMIPFGTLSRRTAKAIKMHLANLKPERAPTKFPQTLYFVMLFYVFAPLWALCACPHPFEHIQHLGTEQGAMATVCAYAHVLPAHTCAYLPMTPVLQLTKCTAIYTWGYQSSGF